MRIEIAFAQANALWRHFDQFIVVDISNRLLKRHPPRRREADRIILAAAGAEVGELFSLHRVDFEIVGLGIFADDHAFIQYFLRRDHQDAALFEEAQRISIGFAAAV